MSGTVHYVRVSPDRLLGTPAAAIYRPGHLIVRVVAPDLDPSLIDELNAATARILALYDQTAQPAADPALGCWFHRVRTLPGSRLLVAEIDRDIANVAILDSLISEELAAALSALGTNIGRYLRPRP